MAGSTGRRASGRSARVAPLAAVLAACATQTASGSGPAAAPAAAGVPVHVQMSGWGPGSRVTGDGIDCQFGQGACATTVEEHGSRVLRAAPGVGAALKAWSGCTPSPGDPLTCTVTVGEPGAAGGRAIAVVFGLPAPTPPPRTSGVALAVVGSGWGTVTGGGLSCSLGTQGACNAELPDGETVTLTATPGPNSWTAGWKGCTPTADAGTCTVRVAGVVAVRAIFDNGSGGGPYSPTQRLTAKAWSARPGNRIQGGPIDCTSGSASGGCTADLPTGETVTLRAAPAPGSTFVRWEGCTTVAEGTCTVTLAKPTWIGAVFGP